MNNTWYGPLLSNFPGLALVPSLDGSFLYFEYVEDYLRFTARAIGLVKITQACALPMIMGDRVVG